MGGLLVEVWPCISYVTTQPARTLTSAPVVFYLSIPAPHNAWPCVSVGAIGADERGRGGLLMPLGVSAREKQCSQEQRNSFSIPHLPEVEEGGIQDENNLVQGNNE